MAGMDGFNLSRFEQNGGEFTDNIYKRTFLKKKKLPGQPSLKRPPV